jgi:hypothetical protein
MNPSDYITMPFNSRLQKAEAEIVALNIIKILSRSGDAWRKLTWFEYKDERLKDRHFYESELAYFNQVVPWTDSAVKAANFSPVWSNIFYKEQNKNVKDLKETGANDHPSTEWEIDPTIKGLPEDSEGAEDNSGDH